MLQRLGIDQTMERAGALRNGLDVWTDGGWYVMPDDAHGYDLRREKLDPMLRELAARTPKTSRSARASPSTPFCATAPAARRASTAASPAARKPRSTPR